MFFKEELPSHHARVGIEPRIFGFLQKSGNSLQRGFSFFLGKEMISPNPKNFLKEESRIFRKGKDFSKRKKFPSKRNLKFSGKERISANLGKFLQRGITMSPCKSWNRTSDFRISPKVRKFPSKRIFNFFRKGDDFPKLRKFPSKRNLTFSGKERISPNLGNFLQRGITISPCKSWNRTSDLLFISPSTWCHKLGDAAIFRKGKDFSKSQEISFKEDFQFFRKGDDFPKPRKFPSKRNLKFSGKERIFPNAGNFLQRGISNFQERKGFPQT